MGLTAKMLVLLTYIYSTSLCTGLEVPWKSCPKVALGEMTCDRDKHLWLMKPLAYIPGGGDTINMFHNPYSSILSCATFEFYCTYDHYALAAFYIMPKARPQLTCPPFTILPNGKSAKVKLETDPRSPACATAERWLALDMFVYQREEFIFLYGCSQPSSDLPVKIGAWLLTDVNASDSLKANVLQKSRAITAQIPEIREDWWIYSNESHRCDGRKEYKCDYLAQCLLSKDGEEQLAVISKSVTINYVVIVGSLVFVALVIVAGIVYKRKQKSQVRPAP